MLDRIRTWLGRRGMDTGLLLLRLLGGGMMLTAHGLPKLVSFGERMERFADPVGVGTHASLVLAVFAEVFCALAVVLGVGTRLAALALVITMLVAAFIVHGDDPFSKRELALVYATIFGTLLLTGAGSLRLRGLAALERWS